MTTVWNTLAKMTPWGTPDQAELPTVDSKKGSELVRFEWTWIEPRIDTKRLPPMIQALLASASIISDMSVKILLTLKSAIAGDLGKNPYRICRRYLEKRGAANIHTYGETPLSSLEKIAKWAGLTEEDVVYDLGCGPGRTSLWLYHFIGCTVVGVEQIPQFIKRAKRLERRRLRFLEADYLNLDYSEATAVYLYGTTMEEGEIRQLLRRLETLPEGAKVITVSFPLTDYAPDSYQLLDTLTVPYTWGKADVYLNLRRPCCNPL